LSKSNRIFAVFPNFVPMATAALIRSHAKPEDAPDPTAGLLTMTTSALRNKLGEVMGNLGEGILLVTHAKPKAVLVPYERFLELHEARKPSNAALEFLSSQYDNLIAAMSTPASRAATDLAFAAEAEVFAARSVKE
jgi:prevent-host-death family protein